MSSPLALGIDLGGTQLRVAVVGPPGNVLRRSAQPTDVAGGPGAIVNQMLEMANEVTSGTRHRLTAVGVSAPGPLDSARGRIIDIPTLPGWTGYPLRQILEDKFALPAMLENDGIAAAFGEWKCGAGRGLANLVYVTVSTGIGGGVVADGRVVRGWRGMAGHVGHMMIAADGPRCSCGGTGCFEALASGTAFNLAARAGGYDSAPVAVKAARTGDEKALAIVSREADLLGYGFASLLYLFSPERLIMGGGVSQAFDLMSVRIHSQIERLVMPSFRQATIVTAELGDDAGLTGAALLALSQSHRA